MHTTSSSIKAKNKRGFTLVELLVTITIFAFTTAFVAIKYANFSQGILLTNLAYDMALTIRQAQSYGVSVKDVSGFTGGSSDFTRGFGVYFSQETNQNKEFTFFVDKNNDGRYIVADDQEINTFKINKGNIIKEICSGSGPGDSCGLVSDGNVTISFRRPDPSPIIINQSGTSQKYAEIRLSSPDGSIATVIVRDSGQISIE